MKGIHSETYSNWETVQQLHQICHEIHVRHNKSPTLTSGNFSRVFIEAEESRMVGVLMTWSVMTLESMSNHALAEVIEHEIPAINAIEDPEETLKNLLPKYERGEEKPKLKSELSKKLIILADRQSIEMEVLKCADWLANRRNNIVHSKPFKYERYGEDEIESTRLATRGDYEYPKYSKLESFFTACDHVREFIQSKTMEMNDVPSFSELLRNA